MWVAAATASVGTTSACAENTRYRKPPTRQWWNYLRVRGEYPHPRNGWSVREELPPRARRIPHRYDAGEGCRGTTSACAENTCKKAWIPSRAGNYLRVRGEYGPGVPCTGDQGELPPRARRIRFTPKRCRMIVGTTSACAENTERQSWGSQYMRNYLRVRGEYIFYGASSTVIWELPPRARRIHTSYSPNRFLYGTTSACAENTSPVGCL